MSTAALERHAEASSAKNIPTPKRVICRSMGERCEDMAKTWRVGREDRDRIALKSHQRAVAAQDADFSRIS
jgi:acetyl-CoA C-acetyltransferase